MHRKRRLCLFTIVLLAYCLLMLSAGLSAIETQGKPQLQTGLYLGVASCASSNCHGSVQPRSIYDVKQNEYFTWLKQDKHAQAYKVLLNEKSARMARNLKLKEKPYQNAKCLDCHALNVPEKLQARPLDLVEGISCEACHGPTGGWIAKHTEEGWTHEDSVKAGMVDLRNLVRRAEICLACHLGNDQKTVNHELIASGHPDLVFELDNYTAVMPPHWMPFTDKRNQQGLEETRGARAWAVGHAVAFREGMLQLARRARSESWPEFAEMNCYACHHALKDGGWRQKRSYPSKAGLPHWSPARYAMLRHVVSAFAPEQRAQLDAQVERLSSYIARMNTQPEIVASTAILLAQRIEDVISKIMKAGMDSSVARKWVVTIANDVPYLIDADIHSVEQAVLAINALVVSMARNDPTLANSRVTNAINKLYDDLQDPEQFDPDQFAKHMAELEHLFK